MNLELICLIFLFTFIQHLKISKTSEITNYYISPVKTSTDDIPVFTLGDIEDMLPMNEMYWDIYKDEDGKMFYELHHNDGRTYIENGQKIPFDRQITWVEHVLNVCS